MPAVYHATGKSDNNTDGFHLIQLACSRDLRTWTRLGSRQPFIGPSPAKPGDFGRTQLLLPSAPVERGDELWFYHTGIKYRTLHEDADAKMGAVHLTVLRRDGFVSLDAGEDRGQLITKSLIYSGDQLMLNVVIRDSGHTKVEVLDANHKTLPGLSLKDCVP
ncbi:MAG: hypothetical protein CMJ64_09200 [Planctomycetaceae bacterium]|nr:hypothetical protein [Planctomycetaceae bacterium]